MEAAAAQRYATSGLSAVSHRLMKQLLGPKACPINGFAFSPLSIYSTLSLMVAGSRGSTLRKLLDVFGASSRLGIVGESEDMVSRGFAGYPDPEGPYIYHLSQLWHDTMPKVKPDYGLTAHRLWCFPSTVDFRTRAEEARKFINTQLAEETLIDSMLEPGSVDKDTRLMHTNFFFFKGNWDRPFFTRSRKDYEFHILDGRVVDAQFMHSYDDQFIATHDGFKVLKIPYTLHDQFTRLPITSSEKADLARAMVDLAKAMGRDPPVFPRYSMCFFLPDDHDGLWNLEKMASSQTFVHEHLPDKRIEVGKFRVPMFKLFSSTNVKQVLQDLGVKSLFTRKADVPDMLENDGCSDPFFVNEMLHKVVFAVNEDSAQPTSDSKLCLIDDEGPEPSSGGSDFIIDHPFMFFVVEEVSGAIILAGRVTDPSIMKLSLD